MTRHVSPTTYRFFLVIIVTVSSTLALSCSRGKQSGEQSDGVANQPRHISLNTNGSQVNALAFSPDGKTLAGAADGAVKIWNVQTGELLQTIKAEGDITAVSFSPDGTTLAAAAFFMNFGGELKWWDTQTWNSKQQTMMTTELLGRSVAFSPDGKLLASGNRDGKVSFWDVASAERTKALKAVGGVVSFVAFLPDGLLLASGTSGKAVMKPRPDDPKWSTLQEFGEVALLDISTGKVQRLIPTNDNDTTHYRVAYAQDGKLLATRGADDAIELWDAQTGQIKKSLKGHKDTVYTVAISSDAKTVVSAGKDGVIMLWNTETGAIESSLTGHQKSVTFVLFSPDGKTLASASEDQTVKLWQLR